MTKLGSGFRRLLLAALFTASGGVACTATEEGALTQAEVTTATGAAADAGGHRHAPPQEALDACNGKAAGDACTLTTPDGQTVSSTCGSCGDGMPLACMPPRHEGGPPQAALDACGGKAAGDTCSLTAPDGQAVSGTCRNGPDGAGPLACAPPHPPGGPGRR
jgi:hypothetical protein